MGHNLFREQMAFVGRHRGMALEKGRRHPCQPRSFAEPQG